jgi:hypothetical protein
VATTGDYIATTRLAKIADTRSVSRNVEGRSLRSKRVLSDESEEESEFLDWPCGQRSNGNELSDSPADKQPGVVEEMVGENMTLGEDLAGGSAEGNRTDSQLK